MTSHHVEEARSALVAAAQRVASEEPSLPAIYALAPLIIYSSHWGDALAAVRDTLTSFDRWNLWHSELRKPPPNPLLWFDAWDRTPSLGAALAAREIQWNAMHAHRMFELHHHLRVVVAEVAAIHLALLAEVSPLGAIEYIASMPSDLFIWPAASWLYATGRAAPVEIVIEGASSYDAVLLALAQTTEDLCTSAIAVHAAASQQDKPREQEVTAWRQSTLARFRSLTEMVVQRADRGCILEAWLYHLVRSSDRAVISDRHLLPTVAKIALEAVTNVARSCGATLSDEHDAIALSIRMLLAGSQEQCTEAWNIWHQYVGAENTSLQDCRYVTWSAAGDVLSQHRQPLEAWRSLVVAHEKCLRRRVRSGGYETAHLAMCVAIPAFSAAARLRAEGADLWNAGFEFCRRSFLVDRRNCTDDAFMLPACALGAFFAVFGDDQTRLDGVLAQLPTSSHVDAGRRMFEENRARLIAQPNQSDATTRAPFAAS